MIVSAPDASRTLGKLKVLRHASRSRALNAAMKSSRHCMAAATDWAFWVIGKLARLGARIHAGSRRGREAGKSRRRPPPWTPRAAPLRLSRMFRKARALARPPAPRLGAAHQRLLGLDRLARRPDPHQPALHRRLRRADLAARPRL